MHKNFILWAFHGKRCTEVSPRTRDHPFTYSTTSARLYCAGHQTRQLPIVLGLSRGPGTPSWASLYFPLRLQTGTCACLTALRETWLSAKHRGLSPQLPRQRSLQDRAGRLLCPPPRFLALGACDGGRSSLPFISNPERSWCLRCPPPPRRAEVTPSCPQDASQHP